jgi:hypothetical protein
MKLWRLEEEEEEKKKKKKKVVQCSEISNDSSCSW